MKAVAVDMGATSVRYALGTYEDGRMDFEVVDQRPNVPNGRCWDAAFLAGFCREAAQFAEGHDASLGIDSWGVDHGFLDRDGRLVRGPVLYRDASHSDQYEAFRVHRQRLFELTGIAHQPFNTLYQLVARRLEDPELPTKAEWYLMPDLMNFYLTGVRRHEQTQSSTTQLMGVDGRWCQEAFDLAGWPVPEMQPQPCGAIVGRCGKTPVVAVASHDTGSAVLGVGQLEPGDAYLNVGTWALLGTVLESPLATLEAESGGWTNEWGYGGTIRFLKNIPGFYVINRLHDELGVKAPVGEWLESRNRQYTGRFNPHDPSLYNPEDMPAACSRLLSVQPSTDAEWAQAALGSLVDTIAVDVPSLERTTGQAVRRLRVVGGGSRSAAFCQALADKLGIVVVSGPVEATVLGNLAAQFAALSGEGMPDVLRAVSAGVKFATFEPHGERCASN